MPLIEPFGSLDEPDDLHWLRKTHGMPEKDVTTKKSSAPANQQSKRGIPIFQNDWHQPDSPSVAVPVIIPV